MGHKGRTGKEEVTHRCVNRPVSEGVLPEPSLGLPSSHPCRPGATVSPKSPVSLSKRREPDQERPTTVETGGTPKGGGKGQRQEQRTHLSLFQ